MHRISGPERPERSHAPQDVHEPSSTAGQPSQTIDATRIQHEEQNSLFPELSGPSESSSQRDYAPLPLARSLQDQLRNLTLEEQGSRPLEASGPGESSIKDQKTIKHENYKARTDRRLRTTRVEQLSETARRHMESVSEGRIRQATRSRMQSMSERRYALQNRFDDSDEE
jgi:hypothetical protein